MGLIRDFLGIGKAAKEVAEVFVPNRSKAQEFEHNEHAAALEQYGQEYWQVQAGWFNQLVNGLNRLPRPILALGTVGLFVFAMIEPEAFSSRMIGLDSIPPVSYTHLTLPTNARV
ncbi:MAG: holin family protein, partial [Rhodobacteraceae bacterium]|nr:holin family protein [Paracoccaceae bacterium]